MLVGEVGAGENATDSEAGGEGDRGIGAGIGDDNVGEVVVGDGKDVGEGAQASCATPPGV